LFLETQVQVNFSSIFFLIFSLLLLMPDLSAEESKIIRTVRPPNNEPSVGSLDSLYTQNHLFFERSHLAGIPDLTPTDWRLEITGDAIERPMTLTFAQLTDKKTFAQVELAALAVCSGNRRGLFDPKVPGVQWGHGALGNALWKGVRLRDVLKLAGVKANALEVILDGADVPVNPGTPDFIKSLPLSRALDDSTLIAYGMNGAPLPKAQGFPARIVVPGWTATYWIKQIIKIEVSSKPHDGFWMKTAYRIPKGTFAATETEWPSQVTKTTAPVTKLIVNSLITKPSSAIPVKKGQLVVVSGFAWDDGNGLEKVEVSIDEGNTWQRATLNKSKHKFSWQRFTLKTKAKKHGVIAARSKATSVSGETQPDKAIHNPAGYHHNATSNGNLSSDDKSSSGELVALPEGDGKDAVSSHCAQCHSLDYLEMHAKFLNYEGWKKVVTKMIEKYGAQISKDDAAKISTYLGSKLSGPVP
jgi:DMSO/TMAO reductase YedYZ molybdopterin-dependent catalytic subunit